jgi:hypothetical protein
LKERDGLSIVRDVWDTTDVPVEADELVNIRLRSNTQQIRLIGVEKLTGPKGRHGLSASTDLSRGQKTVVAGGWAKSPIDDDDGSLESDVVWQASKKC